MDGQGGVLALRGVSASYEGNVALDDVTLEITAGEVVALLGANGSGKSTLVQAALGLIPVTGGARFLFSVPTEQFSDWATVGYVPQRNGGGNGVSATVAEVVASGRLARRGFRLSRRSDRVAIAEAIEQVGLSGRVHDSVHSLSGGQYQRVLIARALASEPELLVLDEPTVGIDAASVAAFASTLQRLIKAGRTIVLITHEMGMLAPLVTRVVVMRQGIVIHDAPGSQDYPVDTQHYPPHHPHAPAPGRQAGPLP